MTLKVGVTGGIGSGKSLVCSLFSLIGVPVYNADQRAKSLMDTDSHLISKIIDVFGPEIYGHDRLDRKKMASIVFNDQKKLAVLNSLVHPVVKKDAEDWFNEQHFHYAIKEAALIYETGGDQALDVVIVVTAPLQLRLKRVHRRDGSSYRDILARIKNQWPEAEKIKKADFVIRNNGKRSLVEQVWKLHRKLLSISENKQEKL